MLHTQNPTTTVTYTIVSVVDNNNPTCDATLGNDQVTFTVTETPAVSGLERTCNVSETGYVLEFDVAQGDVASYTVEGIAGTFDGAGTHFTSDEMLAGSSYSIKVYDVNGCDTARVTGSFNCNCAAYAGTMTNTSVLETYCENETAIVGHNGDETLEVEDALMYYLHTSAGGFLSNAIDSSLTPEFTMSAGMTFGTTYYISSSAGNALPSGHVNRLDPCFSFSEGTPIVFNSTPTSTISGDASICVGESSNLNFAITGSGPFNVEYSDGTNTFTLNNINNGHNESVTPASTTTYNVTSVVANNGAACFGTVAGSATITVNAVPSLDLSGTLDVCPGEEIDLPLTFSGAVTV